MKMAELIRGGMKWGSQTWKTIATSDYFGTMLYISSKSLSNPPFSRWAKFIRDQMIKMLDLQGKFFQVLSERMWWWSSCLNDYLYLVVIHTMCPPSLMSRLARMLKYLAFLRCFLKTLSYLTWENSWHYLLCNTPFSSF